MKKISLSIVSVLFAITACDNSPTPSGIRALTEVRYESRVQSWTDTYDYNGEDLVGSITTDRGLGQTKAFSYISNVLSETRTTRNNDEELIFRDSVTYNGSGLIDKIYNFSINAGTGVPLSNIKTFTYDAAGKVTETNTTYLNIPDYSPRRVYTWKGGNIIQADFYTGEELMQEFFYTYDDKPGVNLENFVSVGDIGIRTKNNVVSTDWVDYSGLLDTVCKPCETTYAYGFDNLPVSLQTNWGFSASLIYEVLWFPID